MSEKFRPENQEYKKVEDLPKEEQGEFVDVEGGGFVKKEAAEKYEKAEKLAETAKILKKEEIGKSEDILRIEAEKNGKIKFFLEAAETIGKYDSEDARKIAYHLGNIAENNPERVEKAIETVGKYEGENAGNIAENLRNIAFLNPEGFERAIEVLGGEKVIETIGKYKEHAHEILDTLGRIARDYVEKVERAAEVLGGEKVVETIGKYNNSFGDRSIARMLGFIVMENPERVGRAAETIGKYEERGVAETIASHLRDVYGGNVERAVEVLGGEKVVETIGKYEGKNAEKIAGNLGWIANKNPEEVGRAAETIGKYEGEVAETIAFYLGHIASENPENLGKATEVLGEKKVVETIRKYEGEGDIAKTITYYHEGEVAKKIADKLGQIASKNPEEIKEVVKTVGKYGGEIAYWVVSNLEEIARKDSKLVKKAAETIGKYEGEVAKTIAYYLTEIASENLERATEVLGGKKVVEIIGKYEGEVAESIASHLGHIASENLEGVENFCDFLNNSKRVNKRDLERIPTNLNDKEIDKIKNEKTSLREKANAIEIYRTLQELNIDVSVPSTESEWKEEVSEKISQAIEKRFGVKGKEGEKYIPLLRISQEDIDENKEDFCQLLEQEGKMKKNFPVGERYFEMIVSSAKEKNDPVEATKGLIYGLISKPWRKDEKGNIKAKLGPMKVALRQFEKQKLKDARKYIQGIGPGKIYGQLKSDLEQLERGEASAVQPALEKIKKLIIERGDKQKVEPISDMVAEVEGIGKSASEINSILFRMQNGEIGDIFDNSTTHCCAFFPSGVNKEASLGYMKDENIGLLQAKAILKNGDQKDEIETSGVAIMVNTVDGYNHSVLLVDSVESGETAQRIDRNKFFQNYLDSITKVAKETGAKKILFNSDVANSGPKQFNEFLSSKGIEQDSMDLTKKGDISEERYLESFGGWEKPEGEVRGFVIEV